MTLQDIYNNLSVIIKKESKGNRLSPDDFNRVLESANEAFFKRKLDIYLKYSIQGQKDGELDTRFMEKYLTTSASMTPNASGVIDMDDIETGEGNTNNEDDVAAIVSIKATYDTVTRKVDFITVTEAESRLDNLFASRFTSHPVCYRVGTNLYVLPYDVSAVYITYADWPDVPFLDYYVDTNGAVQWFNEGDDVHVWTTGEIDSSGTTHTTGDDNWTVLTKELDYEPTYHYEFMLDCLAQYGLSLGDGGLVQYAEGKKTEINTR